MTCFTLGQLAEHLGAELRGDASCQIRGLASLEKAGPDQISFLSNPRYATYLAQSRAAAVLLKPEHAETFKGNALLLNNPYIGFARLSQLFDDPRPATGLRHPTAVIAEDAQVDPSVHVGPGAVIESGCVIAAGAVIGALSVIGSGSVIGENTLLHPRVTLYRRVQVGKNCIIHSGAVLGCDGYGFAPTGGDWEKIAQLGNLIIEDQVEIGANTSIDRGALGDTVIHRDVKIDNLVHIAHNVEVGEHTAITACVGIAGSTRIGANCMFGGNSGIAGHIEICDGVQVTGMGMVTGSINEPGVYSSGTGLLPGHQWRKSAVRFRQLDEIHQKVRGLEKQLVQRTDPESES
ncbi:UDP-3-O-(3-hydroxymyristoyl)glucosamine N-acyltransferase [Marinospirillum alkaliphilum]|uniref:UDP-3-O-acylglucosamine N-acyltransferase n=1 Tax=Marinospirillum alkaliphilum DSM 21637 TaxID=1122209 RepID=A0A1K1W3X9_9GAMM|nr:UDP-3-O-(3-hydroxymyristoyl)glucosamine N-acyltransferase [Marinospirillum alkaliphilum]SFX31509.1 UDP-3-O-[3-hydroxymyristoyl] glucosamine N-acyltransferase [Marinospirillum alkaliphilum DSM 21637]